MTDDAYCSVGLSIGAKHSRTWEYPGKHSLCSYNCWSHKAYPFLSNGLTTMTSAQHRLSLLKQQRRQISFFSYLIIGATGSATPTGCDCSVPCHLDFVAHYCPQRLDPQETTERKNWSNILLWWRDSQGTSRKDFGNWPKSSKKHLFSYDGLLKEINCPVE